MQYEPSGLGGNEGSTDLLGEELSESMISELIGSTGVSAPPFIVRIAGLPGHLLEPFSSPACLSRLHTYDSLRIALKEVRRQLVDLLERALPEQAPAVRRFLLNAKRDCFNGRSLRRHAAKAEWQDLSRAAGPLADQALDLEVRVEEADVDFQRVYTQELERERLHLSDVLRVEPLLHGIALGSPDLVEKARIFRCSPRSLGRHEKKVEQSLLRFTTRAAAKLSPYSTLTTIGLGILSEKPGSGGLILGATSHEEISLVRANRTLLDQCQVILLNHPAVLRCCLLAVNDTVKETEPGRWVFLRNGHWEIAPESDRFRYVPAAQVRASLSGPLIDSVLELLKGEALLHDTLVARLLERHDAERSQIVSTLAQLASLGFLTLLPPWRTSELHLEMRILKFLRSLPPDPSLQGLKASLETLILLEKKHRRDPNPEDSARALTSALDRVIEEVDNLAGRGRLQRRGYGLYEDVFVVSSDRGSEGEVVQLSESVATETLSQAELVARFAALFNHRNDLIHTIAAAWEERWPSHRTMGVLDLYERLQGLWSEYLRFDVVERYNNFSSFNPLSLSSVDSLNRIRTGIREKVLELMEESPDGLQLPPRRFAALLDTIPQRYRPLLGCSVFIQPTDRRCRTWVLNRLFEGSGRYLSRYPAAMQEPMRKRFLSHFATRSVVEVEGEPVELLDLMFTHGTMANIRMPQTRRVLEMPGERLDLEPGVGVRLSELRIEFDRDRQDFRLVDGSGRRLLPVHLSSLNNAFLPTILRFLFVFGPYDVRQVFPRPQASTAGGISVSQRLRLGNLVIRRQRWEIGRAEVLDALNGPSAEKSFQNLQRWRTEAGLPRRVYISEQMHRNGDAVQSFKPQYIDFSSPSLAALFLAIVRKNPQGSFLEEALPSPDDYPVDPKGEQRALELQLDSLALRANNREPHQGVLRKE